MALGGRQYGILDLNTACTGQTPLKDPCLRDPAP